MISLPLGVNINNLIDDLRIISWEAADVLLYYSKLLKDSGFKKNILSNKNIDDPVTLADLKVNETVIKRLKDKYRDVNWEILSEENVKTTSYNFNRNADWIWILDPLDGTKDFIQGTGNYAMHLALNFKNKPFLGIVLIPERDELWIASKGQVFCEKRNGTKKFLLRKSSSIISEITLVTSKNHVNPTLTKLIEIMNFKKVIEMGSVGCKIASILRGEADVYISLSLPGTGSPKDWDFASPAAVLENAGGAITNLDNEELIYGKKNFQHEGIIVASRNRAIHGSICNQIKETIKNFKLYPLKS